MTEIPYECSPIGGLVAQGGVATCFEIAFPSRATIVKLIITQTDGDLVDFTAQLFNRSDTCQGSSESDSTGPLTGPLPADLFQVCPPLSGVNGVLAFYAGHDTEGGTGYDFFSHDGINQQQIARLGNARVLYLQISPEGTGDKTFAVVVGGRIYG